MQIWLTFIIMILVIASVISLFSFLIVKNAEENRIFRDIEIAQNIVLNINLKEDSAFLDFDLKRFKEFKFIDHFLIDKDDGSIVFLRGKINDRKPQLTHTPRPEDRELVKLLTAHTDEVGEGKFIESHKDQSIFFLVNSFEDDQKSYYIISYMKTTRIYSDFYKYLHIVLLFIAVAFVASKIIANNLAKPLKKLELYTERIAKKQWAEPLELGREDEIGRLSDAMNRMQIALKNADEEEKLFLQSISHDLKTPVMVIESYAQAIVDEVYMGSLEETALTIKYEANRLKHKIKQLLYLNSLNYIMKSEKVDEEIKVDLLIEELYERFRLVKTDINWEVELEEVNVKGNTEKLRVALENILDNQIRYAESKISIKVSSEKNRARIEIYNDGSNIKEENIKNIFDNFYKDKKGNFGLGLAICKRIVEFHNGDISAKNHDIGVSFVIELPTIDV
ncbi:HAMP domain-containing sensor histidine kinase [Wukongibacter baidiensis]|uniref:sensor histidine kinase n=1 Tax=Wukongibacter baidiensis TaxID=1723361 RepID=UPI003D7F92FE